MTSRPDGYSPIVCDGSLNCFNDLVLRCGKHDLDWLLLRSATVEDAIRSSGLISLMRTIKSSYGHAGYAWTGDAGGFAKTRSEEVVTDTSRLQVL